MRYYRIDSKAKKPLHKHNSRGTTSHFIGTEMKIISSPCNASSFQQIDTFVSSTLHFDVVHALI